MCGSPCVYVWGIPITLLKKDHKCCVVRVFLTRNIPLIFCETASPYLWLTLSKSEEELFCFLSESLILCFWLKSISVDSGRLIESRFLTRSSGLWWWTSFSAAAAAEAEKHPPNKMKWNAFVLNLLSCSFPKIASAFEWILDRETAALGHWKHSHYAMMKHWEGVN